MSDFLRHEACPICPSSDGYAVYENGSGHCFSCGYHKHGNGLERLKSRQNKPRVKHNLTTTLPKVAHDWLDSYKLSDAEKKLFKWDMRRQRLVYLEHGFSNCRCFGDGPKYISYGEKPYSVQGFGNVLVIVEDLLSAIKVARITASLCLYGSTINFTKLPTNYSRYIIHLDKDKQKEAVALGHRLCELGLDCKTVITDLDPKGITTNELKTLYF